MKPYKLIIAYDGTAYHGWQEQAGHPTIAGTLQDSFAKVFGEPIKVVGASRTDTGVHALGQVARFYTSRTLSSERFRTSWNGALSNDIHIRSVEPIIDKGDERIFHPQHNVAQKTYYYHFSARRPLPHWARFVYFYPQKFDEQKLRDGLNCFVGTHNFKSFCAESWRYEDTVCTIDAIELTYLRHLGIYRVTIRGPRFLHNMIRRMVGTALKVASYDDLSVADVQQALSKPGVYTYVQTAPAHGLVLRKIEYKS